MCQDCLIQIRDHLSNVRDFKTARGKQFYVTSISGDKIYLKTEEGTKRFFCITHLADCYHWLKVDGKMIYGVGSTSTNSVRGLVGEKGTIASCSLCERHPAYIWGVLASIPDVERRKGNILFYKES